jgi:hypothetical protein
MVSGSFWIFEAPQPDIYDSFVHGFMACRSLRPELLLLSTFLQCLLRELLALSVGAEDSGKSAWTMEHGTIETEGKSPEFQGR